MISLEELQTRYENRVYSEAQEKCMKELLAYRSMLELKAECEELSERMAAMQDKIDFLIEKRINIPLFFEHYSRRIDDLVGLGHRYFYWLISNKRNIWGVWINGEFKVYREWGSSYAECKPNEDLYRAFLSEFPRVEKEFDEYIKRTVLKGVY